jgi:hypothetical protein
MQPGDVKLEHSGQDTGDGHEGFYHQPVVDDPSRHESQDITMPLIVKRVMFSDMTPIEIDTQKTVAAFFLGQGSSTEAFFFSLGVKNRIATGVLWTLWYIGAVIGLLSIARVLPEGFIWASVLMVPLPVVMTLLLSVDLLREVLSSMDLYVLFILQFAFFVDGIYYCKADIRRLFWYCYLPSMVASGLVDAYPAKYRAFFAKLFFSAAVCILIAWNCLLIFRWQVFGTKPSQKLTNISFALHHFSDQATVLLFYFRHLYRSVWHPSYFVMIKGEVLTTREKLECSVEIDEDGKEREHHFLPHERRRSEVRASISASPHGTFPLQASV